CMSCMCFVMYFVMCVMLACGRALLNPKIVGGASASPGHWPWQIHLLTTNSKGQRVLCGGSLINHEWVLTAAHCLKDKVMDLTQVSLGFSSLSDSPVQRGVVQVELHPDYNDTGSDIALLRLSSPVTYTRFIQPVCLAHTNSYFDHGQSTWVAGWGRLEEGENGDIFDKFCCFAPGGAVLDSLQEVCVPVVELAVCSKDYGVTLLLYDNILCAGYEEGGKGTCQ
ncbi:hypothetical protein NL108_016438, partial [Boleophthalmus pectinirostris]